MQPTPDDSPNWFRQRLRQAPWRAQAQGTSLMLATVMIVAVIGALYLAQASRTAAAGRRLQALESQRQQLEQQNAQLRAEIAALRSVPRLTREAESLGYHPASPDEVEYLVVRGIAPPPEQGAIVAPAPSPPPAEEVAPAYDETLEGWLSEQFAGFRAQVVEFIRNTFGQEQASPTPVP